MPDKPGQAGEAETTPSLWFDPPVAAGNRQRRTLSRDRVVAEALTIISAHGVEALSMRALATQLGVVPGALYRYVHSKEQLYDLVLDEVLAEVDWHVDDSQSWTMRVAGLAQRLRAVLEGHPGIATLLKTREPLSPHFLAMAEAFLTSLNGAGLPPQQTALAFRLIYDYTVGFSLSDRSSAAEQRVRDTAVRRELHAFLRSLPASRFPALASLGDYVWADDRDDRFAASLHTLIVGLQALQGTAEQSRMLDPH